MTRDFKRFITAGLALVLFGGIFSPNLASADATTGTIVRPTQTADQAYPVSSVELPYTRHISNRQATASYLLKKDLTADPDDDVHALTSAQLADSAYMRAFTKYNNNDELASTLPALYEAIFTDPTFDATTTAIQLLYPLLNEDFLSETAFVDAQAQSVYLTAWWIHNLSQYQLDHSHFAQMQREYQEKIRDYLIDADLDTTDYDAAFSSQESFDSPQNHKLLYGHDLPGYLQLTGLTDLSTDELAKLNPAISMAETKRAWNQPVVSYLTPQADGTFQVSGLFMSLTFATYSFDDTLLPPTTTPDPDPDPTPTPVTSQPVTVHYVDVTGKTIAPDKTLTGELGSGYQAPILKLTNYVLKETPANATGNFTSRPQTVTFVYHEVKTSGSSADTVAPKGTVIYATKKIGLYKSATFTSKTRKQWYAKKSRMNRPMFVVTGYAKSKYGVKRYRVKDVNHHSRTAGKLGYVTANRAYTSPVYYASKHKTVTIINPRGVNSYAKQNLTGKKHHYRQGQTVKVKKIVRHNLTTRFVLSNGRYITANKKLVQAGRVTMPKRVAAKGALNRYTTANLTKRNRHYTRKAQATFTVQGWDYSNANNFSKGDTLRYRVAGGYVSGNSQLVRQIR